MTSKGTPNITSATRGGSCKVAHPPVPGSKIIKPFAKGKKKKKVQGVGGGRTLLGKDMA